MGGKSSKSSALNQVATASLAVEPPPTRDELEALVRDLGDDCKRAGQVCEMLTDRETKEEVKAACAKAEKFLKDLEPVFGADPEGILANATQARYVKIELRHHLEIIGLYLDDMHEEADLLNAKQEKELEERGAYETFNRKYEAAINEAINRERRLGEAAYKMLDTWHQHTGGITLIHNLFITVLKEQGETMGPQDKFEVRFQKDYGAATVGNYISNSGGGGKDDGRSI